MGNHWRIAVTAVVSFWSAAGSAGPLTEKDVYTRCYARFVRAVVPAGDAFAAKVAAGTMRGADACLALYDTAALGESTGTLDQPGDLRARAILKTMNDLHQSWFQSKSLAVNMDKSTALVSDIEEPGLYFTRAALQRNAEARSVLTSTTGLRGVRVRPANSLSKFQSQRVYKYPEGLPISASPDFLLAAAKKEATETGFKNAGTSPLAVPDANLVDVGALIGVRAPTDLTIPSFVGTFPLDQPEMVDAAKLIFAAPFVAHQHMGGGVIGSQTFLMNNYPLIVGQVPTGYTHIHRRIAGRVFEDLLCHQLPTLTDADVAAEVSPTSSFTFQRSTACLRCHSSLDPAAFAMRNLVQYRTAARARLGEQEVGEAINGIQRLPVVKGAFTFALQPPEGRLRYRELLSGDAAPVNLNVSSLQQMGLLLSRSPDFYLCAAKRYYRFLTGIDVDVTNVATAKLDKVHQDRVVDLGRKLKDHQSIRTLLHQILQSDAFRSRNSDSRRIDE